MTRVVAVNIPHSLRPRAAAHDARLAFNEAGLDGVVLACEIDRSNDGPFEEAAHRTNHRVRFRSRKTQVAHPGRWRDLDAQLYRLTTPIPGINPGRDLAALFHHADRVVYCAAHMTNGKNKRSKSRWRLRGIKWGNYERKAARRVARWVDGGWSVVIGGDLNDVDGARFHARQETVAHAGLMWIIAVPAPGRRVQVSGRTRRSDNEGDHPLIAANITTYKE